MCVLKNQTLTRPKGDAGTTSSTGPRGQVVGLEAGWVCACCVEEAARKVEMEGANKVTNRGADSARKGRRKQRKRG